MLSKLSTEYIRGAFAELNLQTEHARLYVALLETGTTSVGMLEKKTGFPRASIYMFLEDLIILGLISKVKGETKLLFTAANPSQLESFIVNKISSYNKMAKQIREVSVEFERNLLGKTYNMPRVRWYEGENGLRMVYRAALSGEEILVVCQGSPDVQTGLTSDPDYLKDFIEKTISRGIKTREILEENPSTREYQARYQSSRNEMLVIPRLKTNRFGHVDKQIYNHEVSYVAHDNRTGFIIEDPTIAAAERSQFEQLWKYWKRKLK